MGTRGKRLFSLSYLFSIIFIYFIGDSVPKMAIIGLTKPFLMGTKWGQRWGQDGDKIGTGGVFLRLFMNNLLPE